jgi:hypothetical protein
LNGSRTKTWTKDDCFWPQDLLPDKIPTARVLTFGYNADLALNYSTYGIKDHALKLLTCLRDKREEANVSVLSWHAIPESRLIDL